MQVTAEVNGALEIFATIVAVILLIDNIISKSKVRLRDWSNTLESVGTSSCRLC